MNNELKNIFKVMNKDNFTTNEEARNYIEAIFKGYSKRKRNGSLYTKDDLIPQILIGAYYTYVDRMDITEVYNNLEGRYIYNENRLQDDRKQKERQGLSKVYDYLKQYTNYGNVNVYTMLQIHKILYSLVDYPEFGGRFRTMDVFLPGTGINLASYSDVPKLFQNLFVESSELAKRGSIVAENPTPEQILDYVDDCVELICKIIKIHPFMDGNTRSSRALLNLYFKIANIPPVYVKNSERLEYQAALKKAICDEEYNPDFTAMKRFYYYRLCDSIVELDIVQRKKSNQK